MFLYFAVITPIVTFGGLLADATNNNLAAIESMVGGMMAGCLYHLFSGQPLTIIGSTGPILVFETIMYQIATDLGLYYLELRVWVGIFTGILSILIVAFDLSYLVMYITRYTEESFSTLISLIFITDGFKKLWHIIDDYPVNTKWKQENVFSYSCECSAPQYVQSDWPNSQMEESDWIRNASSRSIGHGDKSKPEITWMDNQVQYHCIYGNQYKLLNVSSINYGNQSNKAECFDVCGVLSGPACTDSKIYVPDVFLFSLFLAFGTLFLR